MNTVFDYTVKDRKGNAVSLRSYANEVLLIVNTATKSPYTPQYTELEALYEKYHSQGFAVLDFPSNQPTKSCPGKDDMVHEFVKETYNTEFPRFKKVKVSGSDADPLFAHLASMTDGDVTEDFTKFVINKMGRVAARFSPETPIPEVESKIAELMG